MNRKSATVDGEALSRLQTAWPATVLSYLAILLAFALGILNLTQAFGINVLERVSRLESFMDLVVWGDASLTSFLLGAFLVALAYQLWRRKRAALLMFVVLLGVEAALCLMRDARMAGVSCAALAVLFLTTRNEFPARPDPRSFRRLAVAAPCLVASFYVAGVCGLFLMRGRLDLNGNVFRLAYRASAIAVGQGAVNFQGWEVLFRDFLVIAAMASVMYMLTLLFRPVRARLGHTDEEHGRALEIVKRHGSDSLAYFNLRRDKSLFFSGDDTFIAYRCDRGMAIISGDPVGPVERIPRAMREFADFCAIRGWRFFVFAANGRDELYREAGLKTWLLGEEAVVDLDPFGLEGRRMRKLRQSVSKMERLGYTVEFMFNAGIPAHMRHELVEISSTWRGDKPETGFSMGLGRLLSADDPECLLVVARDAGGMPVGFLHMVPMYPRQGYSLDVTRTEEGTPGALTDYLYASTALFLKGEGYRYMSLHFLPLSQFYREDSGEKDSAFWNAVASVIGRMFPAKKMYAYDKKFLPGYRERRIVYQNLVDFPSIAVSTVRAESAMNLSRPGRRNHRTRTAAR